MMDCEGVRLRLDEAPTDVSVRAHLERCLACRLEAAFSQRVAAAVESMPRVPAPEGFLDGVMAAVQSQVEATEPVRRGATLLLRPWELAWIGLACLAVLGFLSRLLSTWMTPRGAARPALSWSEWQSRLGAAAGERWVGLQQQWAEGSGWFFTRVEEQGLTTGSELLLWACGAAAFALALYMLLSWSRGSEWATSLEDAHA